MKAKTGDDWKEAGVVSVKVSGAWKPVEKVFARVSGEWKEVFDGRPSVSLDNTALSGTLVGDGVCTTSDDSQASASGGSGSYTYAWSLISGEVAIEADAPTSASTTFSADGIWTTTWTAVFRCRVTDSVTGLYRDSGDVSVELNWEEP